MEGTIGEVRMFAGNFAPNGWAFCQGQTVSINQYAAAFSLLGTKYGGNGQQNFNLPNLSSRLPVGVGQGPGLSNYLLAATGGIESNTLAVTNLPTHTHTLTGTAGIVAVGEDGHKLTPVNSAVASNGDQIYSTIKDNNIMALPVVSLSPGSAGTLSPSPISNIKPILAMNYIICLEGIYPSQP